MQNGTYVSKMFMKEPHTALFVAPTGVGKTDLALSLLETEYRNPFDFIVIICPPPPLRYIALHTKIKVVFGMILMSFP